MSALFLSRLPSGLYVSSFLWSNNWTYHRTDYTNQQTTVSPRDPAFALIACLLLLHISFCSLCFPPPNFLFFRFPCCFFRCCRRKSLSRRVYICRYTMDGYAAGVTSLQVTRDGWYSTAPYSTVPLRAAAVHALFCFFHRGAFCSLTCDHGRDFGKMMHGINNVRT